MEESSFMCKCIADTKSFLFHLPLCIDQGLKLLVFFYCCNCYDLHAFWFSFLNVFVELSRIVSFFLLPFTNNQSCI
jgi:hypothetical protein